MRKSLALTCVAGITLNVVNPLAVQLSRNRQDTVNVISDNTTGTKV
jgi:hypothetical protein